MRRLLDTQRMLVQFSRENDRLAGENGRLRTGKTLVANDYAGAGGWVKDVVNASFGQGVPAYTLQLCLLLANPKSLSCSPHAGALEEVDWLKLKLETLEAALLSGSLDSGLLAALDGGSGLSRAEVLEAARAAVQSAVLQSPEGAAQQGVPQDDAQQGASAAAAEAAAGGRAVGELLVGQLSTGRASMQVEDTMPAEAPQAAVLQPTILTKPPLIERLLISEVLEVPASSAADTLEVTAPSAAGVTATVSLVGPGADTKAGAAVTGQQGGDGVALADLPQL